MPPHITAVKPREQAGPQTGRKYEVQYEEAALACLRLLKEDSIRVFCEWHDDFVVEESQQLYAFHQVKTRSNAQGAWSALEILGVKTVREKKKKAPAKKKQAPAPCDPPPLRFELRTVESIAHRMLDHHRKFGSACASFNLISPTTVSHDLLYELVIAARTRADVADLPPDHKASFDALLAAYQSGDNTVTESELWALVSRINFVFANASEANRQVADGLMGQIIYELSEVNVSVKEQGRIADDLLRVVRQRSHDVLDPLPNNEEDVCARKAVSLQDVLRLIPLSTEGYERLRAGDSAAVKSLSRLQRLCRDSNMGDRMIVDICGLKVDWQMWRSNNRDSLTNGTLASLRMRGLNLLSKLQHGGTFEDLRRDAQSETQNLPAEIPPITCDEFMGLVFALAAEQNE